MVQNNAFVYFIVVNFNGRYVIEECLDSLFRQDYSNFKILVVDNHSTDGSIDQIESKYPEIELLKLDRNYGFARANNLALEFIWEADPDYVAFINNDIVLENDWLSSILKFLIHSPYDSAQTLITQSMRQLIIDTAGIGVSRHLKIYDRKSGESLLSEEGNRSIFGPCLAAAVYKREVLEDLKSEDSILDERFHTFYEDVDMSFRANSAGYKAGLLARPLCRHRRSHTADQRPFKKYFLIGRNYFLILRKHIPSRMIIKNFIWIKWDRMQLLLHTFLHPVFFFGFLFGSILGSLCVFQKRESSLQTNSTKSKSQKKVLGAIKEGLYE